jgi:iron complex transport system substrate-binding protein
VKAVLFRCVILALLICGPGALADVFAAEKVTVIDMAKRTVEVPFNPQRIICLSPGTLRLIVYLQATSKVVGVEDLEKTIPTARPYVWAHPELTGLPTVGPGGPVSINKEPDLEAVLKVQPDVIFISYMESDKADSLQKKLRIPVVVLTYGPFAAFDELVYDSLRVVGRVLNKETRAEAVVAFIERVRKDGRARTAGIEESKKPSVYVGAVGFKGGQGIESTDASYTPLEWVGARNLAKNFSSRAHLFVDKEKLLQWDPDIIFIDGGGSLVKQDLSKQPEFYKGLKAFREKRVYVLHPFNNYVTNIDTAMGDAYTVGAILYPKNFADINLREKADEIYTFLLGKPIYEEMERLFGPLGRPAEFP